MNKQNATTLSNKFFLQAGLIMLLTLLIYIPAMQAGFIWDDDLFLTNNPLIKADDGLYRFWFTTEAPDYFPLVSSLLWFEWRLWGMNAKGYHIINVLLHALSSVLLWLVLKKLKIPGAWLIALIFAIHPVNVESVAWIAERKNTQPLLFYLLTILLYLQYERKGNRHLYFFTLFTFLLALLSKTSVVMLPFVLLGCAWWQRGTILRKDLVRSIPFFILSVFLSMVTIWFQYNVAIGDDIIRTGGFFSRLAGAGWAVWFYLYKAIIPYKLSFIYPKWNIDPYSVTSYLPGLMLLGCLGIAWKYRKGWGRALLFALGYFVVTLFPVLGFFDINFMRFSLVTDHWQYTSIIGIIALVVGVGTWMWYGWQKQLRQVGVAVTVFLVSLLCILTIKQTRIYRNVETLWRDTISKNSKAWLAYSNLGATLVYQGKFDEAITYLSQALRINPTHGKIHCTMGAALAGQNRLKKAVYHFSEALRLEPAYAQAHNDLGLALKKLGRIKEAAYHFSEALRLQPESTEFHSNLAMILAEQGRFNEAINHFSEAVRLEPDSAGAHYNLGIALAGHNEIKQAIYHLSKAISIESDFAEAHCNLGAMLARDGKLDDAIYHFSTAVKIKPDFAEALNALGTALNERGNPQEAITHFTKAIRIAPNFLQAHMNLCRAYWTVGDRDSAMQEYEIVKNLNPSLANELLKWMNASVNDP